MRLLIIGFFLLVVRLGFAQQIKFDTIAFNQVTLNGIHILYKKKACLKPLFGKPLSEKTEKNEMDGSVYTDFYFKEDMVSVVKGEVWGFKIKNKSFLLCGKYKVGLSKLADFQLDFPVACQNVNNYGSGRFLKIAIAGHPDLFVLFRFDFYYDKDILSSMEIFFDS
jgi:hypothetical protein